MRSRPHLSLIVTAFGSTSAPSALELLGATTRFVWGESIISSLRLGASSRLVADAIVIDATSKSLNYDFDYDGGYGILARSLTLAYEIRRLVDSKMPTGVRWSAIPIVVLVENRAVVSSIRMSGASGGVIVCAQDAGWVDIYDRVSEAVLEFSLELVRQMVELGWEIRYVHGRWIRVRVKLPRRRGGFRPDFESELYDGTADEWLRARTVQEKLRFSLIASDENRTLADILHLHRLLIGDGVTEPALQRLIEEAPYLLHASQMELIAHPKFVDESTGDVKFPDVVLYPALGNRIDITELKLPTARLVAKRGKLVFQAADVTEGVAQVRDYAEIAVKTTHRSQMEALFGEPVEVNSRSLVIGMSAGVDPEQWEKVRSYIDDVLIRTWDEVRDDAIRRYLS